MNNYQKKENEGREVAYKILKLLGNKHIAAAIDEFDNIDLLYFNPQYQTVACELKNRSIRLDHYPTAIIDRNKLKALYRLFKHGIQTQFFYLCKDGFIIFNLNPRFANGDGIVRGTLSTPRSSVENKGTELSDICHLSYSEDYGDLKITANQLKALKYKKLQLNNTPMNK